MNEKEILSNAFKYLRQNNKILVAPGHDCAAIKITEKKLIIATADQLIEGIHYSRNTSPAKIARKLIARNLSDIAAAGGAKNLFALCTIALSNDRKIKIKKWFDEFFASLGKYSAKFGLTICGGDIAKIAKPKQSVITMSLFGESSEKKICTRAGAKAGDLLLATGKFGNSCKSNHHIEFTPRIIEADFLSGKYTNTMIDVSDGLLIDSSRLAEASGLGIILDTKHIPLRKGADIKSALSEGEDYELLFALSPKKLKELKEKWPFPTKLTTIGKFAKIAKGKVFSEEGIDLISKFDSGFDHFK